MKSRTIIVTGGGSGIGAATARHLASLGASVAIVDVADASSVVDEISSSGGVAEFFRADVSSSVQVEEMVDAVAARFGRVDGAFNNAGIEQCNLPLHELTSAQWDRAIRIDLTGVFNCLKYEAIAMLKTGGGAIVNTASGLSKVAIPNAAEYVAAKHGVVGLTLAAAADYGRRGIRVNAVLPGVVNTPMITRVSRDPEFVEHFDAIRDRHLLGRFAEPVEIAEAVSWLLSDQAAFVTGATLAVDGGFLAN
ncbi:SDR family NAD(P)-dependent oxidoreductase [Streptomyces mirabilis]|uniref:SDR family NAD(P)-dependent oxidoreductase n=1 Tax=Streptomyces mirabilis TaxID=68239 RepID=UPI0033F2DCB5